MEGNSGRDAPSSTLLKSLNYTEGDNLSHALKLRKRLDIIGAAGAVLSLVGVVPHLCVAFFCSRHH